MNLHEYIESNTPYYAGLFTNAGIGAAVWQRGTGVCYGNGCMDDIFNLSGLANHAAEDRLQTLTREMQGQLREPAPSQWANRHILASNGITYSVIPRKTVMLEGENEVHEIFFMPVSITEMTNRWNRVFNALSDSVCLLDKDFKVIDINAATEQLVQKKRSDVIGRHCSEVLHNGTHLFDDCPALQHRVPLDKATREIQLNDAWYEDRLEPLFDPQGAFIGSLHLMRDITHQKETESKLRQREEELLESNQAKDRFFSIIAHDLRSPFHTLLNLCQILNNEAATMPQSEIIKFASILYNEQKRVFNLVENLLQWGSIHRGTIEFAPQRQNLSETVIHIISLLRTVALEKSLLLTHHVPEECFAEFDENMISLTIRNLISNAIKFTPHGGKITVSIQPLTDTLELKVADTGVGIGADDLDKLFKIDSHFSTAGTNNEKGTGLGLILVKEFISKHSGSLRVESEPGRGTSFIVTLPYRLPA